MEGHTAMGTVGERERNVNANACINIQPWSLSPIVHDADPHVNICAGIIHINFYPGIISTDSYPRIHPPGRPLGVGEGVE